ncbi:hypothetical protein ACP4OV_027914 [Aristida adscensionis]
MIDRLERELEEAKDWGFGLEQHLSRYADEVVKLRRAHADEIAKLNQEHAVKIAGLNKVHTDEVARLQEEAAEKVQIARAEAAAEKIAMESEKFRMFATFHMKGLQDAKNWFLQRFPHLAEKLLDLSQLERHIH